MPLQLDIDQYLIEEAGEIDVKKMLILSHNRMGETLININAVSKDMILEALADPNKFPDLVVPVTGYSAYFYSLSPEYP